MNCRSCYTPIPSRSSSCPNCGRGTHAGESFIDDPGDDDAEDLGAASEELSPSTAMDDSFDRSVMGPPGPGGDDEGEELSLDDAVATPSPPPAPVRLVAQPAPVPKAEAKPVTKLEITPQIKPEAKQEPKPEPKPGTKPEAKPPATPIAKPPTPPPAKLVAVPRPQPTQVPPSASTPEPRSMPGSAALPDPDVVRSILAEHPELLEPGLELLVDDTVQEVGVRHATDVGMIDLLARDADGRLVAVIVADPASRSDLVAEALHRVGWVRKHLAKQGEDVRAIVVTDHLDTQLAYAASAVSDKITFKSYALSLVLTDLEF